MPSVAVKVFGKFEVETGPGSKASFRTSRAAEVVALLAMQPAGQLNRTQLADAIWPEMLPSEQLKSLRPALHYAKASVGESALFVDEGSGRVVLQASSEWHDAKKLELRIAAEAEESDRLMLLYALSNLVREPLFASWDRLWMEPYRQRHHILSCRTLFGLAELLGAKGETEMALEHIHHVRQMNPIDEAAVKLQLQLLGKLDRVAEARKAYEDFRTLWRARAARDVNADVAAVATKALSGGYAQPNARIVSSVQLELVQNLFTVLSEEAPERLLPLLAAQQVNWAIVSHGPELKSLLEAVLERTTGWSPDRAGVAKRLLQFYSQEGESQRMRRLAIQLMESPRALDQVAALNYLGMHAANSGDVDEAEAVLTQATKLCEQENLPYLAAVSQANLAFTHFYVLKLDTARVVFETVIASLSEATEPNARYNAAHCLAAMIHIAEVSGETDEALRLADEWVKMAQLDEAVRKDSAGLATASLVYERHNRPMAVQYAIQALDAALSGRQKVMMTAVGLALCAVARRIGLEDAAREAARELLAWIYVFRLELRPLERLMFAEAGLVVEDETIEAPTSLPRTLVNLREAFELYQAV